MKNWPHQDLNSEKNTTILNSVMRLIRRHCIYCLSTHTVKEIDNTEVRRENDICVVLYQQILQQMFINIFPPPTLSRVWIKHSLLPSNKCLHHSNVFHLYMFQRTKETYCIYIKWNFLLKLSINIAVAEICKWIRHISESVENTLKHVVRCLESSTVI